MIAEPRVGLVTGRDNVPLEGVRIDVRMTGPCVDVTVTQRYRNRESVPVEAVYVFPLDEGAAVCGFSVRLGDALMRGKVEERDAAFARYDDAMHAGHGAFLLDQERPNVFTASVGNLRPGEEAELKLRYVALCAREGDALRLMLPTTVSPRYVPKEPSPVGEPDGERVNPPHWSKVPYGLALGIELDLPFESAESPSHPVRMVLKDDGARIELAQDEVALDRDFVLRVTPRARERAMVRVAREGDGRRVAMLSFVPEDVQVERGHEVSFLLDCSGSMRGESIEQAKRALLLCIRALSPGDRFNVVCFGTNHRALWEAPRAYDQATLDEATRHVQGLDANLGGTEILAPLRDVLEAKIDGARARRVLLLTDGQVSNEDQVLALARKHQNNARVFAFGIGAGVSEHLVRGVARASRGAAELIAPGERIEPKVLRTFARLRTATADDFAIDWHGLSVETAPRSLPPVFADDVLTLFARVESGASDHVTVTAFGKSLDVPLDLEHASTEITIPTLWARERIRELDDETERHGSQQRREEGAARRREQLVELGTRYGLLSSATSFVAVEERADQDRTTEPAALRRIPVALTAGWGGAQVGGPPPGAIMPLMAMAPMAASATMPDVAPKASGGMAKMMSRMRSFATGAPPPPASPAPKRERMVSPSDRLFDLLMTQRADGSFEDSDALARWLGEKRAQKLAEAIALHGEAVVVTSVVVALLEKDEPSRSAEWRAAAIKARAFLGRQAASFDAESVL